MNKTPTKIAFTGHRHLSFAQVAQYLEKLFKDYPDAIWITGGAIGLDSWAAKFAIDHEIELWLILPFPSKVMSKKWKDEQRELLEWSINSSKFSVSHPPMMSRYISEGMSGWLTCLIWSQHSGMVHQAGLGIAFDMLRRSRSRWFGSLTFLGPWWRRRKCLLPYLQRRPDWK